MMKKVLGDNEENYIQTDFADYKIDDDGILRVEFKIKLSDKIQLLDAYSYISIVLQITKGIKRPFLLNFLGFNNLPNPKVIDFLAKNEDLQSLASAKAIVLTSSVYRAIFNQYSKIVIKKYPIKSFETEKEAVEWLNSM